MSRQVKKVNISGKEDKSNKVTSWSNNPNHNHYPTEKLVKDSIADVESSITEIEKPKFQWKDFFDLDNWSEELVDYNRPTYLGNGELQDGGDGMGFNFPTNKPLPKNYTMTFNLHPSANGWGYYFTINSTGIIQNGTGDYDVSIVCEDGVATVTTSPTTDTYTFNTPITFFDVWFSSGGIIRNFTYSESLVPTLTVYEENALTNLGTSANATQSTINSAINTLLNDKLDIEDAFTGSYDDLSNKPSIPSASSDLSDGSDLVKKSSTVGLLKNDGSVMSSGTGSSNWAVGNHTHTTTDITNLSIPNASSTTPSADTENGSVGTGTTWARSNHTHPKSSLYAESSHNHTKSQITDFPSIPSKTSDLQNDSGFLTSHQDISGKEDTTNKVTSLSSSSTDTQYPSAKTVYDELMTVRTVTPKITVGGSSTINNVTKDWHETSHIIRPDFEHFEKIVYNITFEDNDFQIFYQYPIAGVDIFDIKMVYFDGTDCYWGIPNSEGLTKGSLICEGNTIQATANKDNTITINDTITNWDIYSRISMFGDVDFTYTVYSHKYLDTDFPYNFGYANSSKGPWGEYTVNSVTKEYGELYLSEDWENTVERIYTITFNDDDFSYLQIDYDAIIYFDGVDCYWGEWVGGENDNYTVNKGTLICEGNVVQATYNDYNGDGIYFPDGYSISNMGNLTYFGDVNIKVRNKALLLEYASNKVNSLSSSYYDESIVYPSVSAVKNYAENKSNKVTSWSNTLSDVNYPSEKLVKDTIDSLSTSYSYLYYDDFNNDVVLSTTQKDQDILFFDNLNSKKAINYYGTIPDLVSGTDATYTISYDSTEQAYWFRGMCCITPLTGITENFTLSVDMKKTINGGSNGLIYIKEAGGDGFWIGTKANGHRGGEVKQNGSVGGIGISGTSPYNNWYRLKLIKNGTSISIKIYDLNDNIISNGTAKTYENGDNYYGIILDGYFKNVIAKIDR